MTTPINALRYGTTGDTPNMFTFTKNLADDLDTRVVPRFTTTGARDSTITAPVRGMECNVCASDGAVVFKYVYNGSAWKLMSQDPGTWQNITLESGFITEGATPQIRENGGNIELRGGIRSSTNMLTSAVLVFSHALVTIGGGWGNFYYASVLGQGASHALTNEHVILNPRNDHGVRVYATAGSLLQYFNLSEVHPWPSS